jgi:hypothetical protein
MSNDLATLDIYTLATVSGGSKASQQELKTAMTQIKDSLSSLKKQVTTPASDPTQMVMMMMMMKNR